MNHFHLFNFSRRGAFRLGCLLLAGALLALAVTSFNPSAIQAVTGYATQLTRYPYLTDMVGGNVTINFATDQSLNSAFVQFGTPPDCTANTVQASPGKFIVYPAPYYAGSTVGMNEYQWSATITGLQAGTHYCYRVFMGTAPGFDLLGSGNPSPTFTTLPAAGSNQPVTFAVLGNFGTVDINGVNPDQTAILSQIASINGLNFIVSTGDTASTTAGYVVNPTPVPTGQPTPTPDPSATPAPQNPPLQTIYGDLYHTGPSTSAFFGPNFWTVAGASLPLFSAPSNRGFSTPFLTNFPQAQAANLSGGRYLPDLYPGVNGTTPSTYPSVWYAFDVGNVRVYILTATWPDNNLGTATAFQNDYDSHWTASSAEYQWLQADLATHPDAMKFAVFHYPIYSDGVSGSDTFLQGSNSLEGLLSQYGVVMAFSGNSHIYERNIKPNDNSLITYEIGTSGSPVEAVGGLHGTTCSPFDAYAIGYVISKAQGTACGNATAPTSSQEVMSFLRVEVNGNTVTVTPTNELGQTFDVQSYTFNPVPGVTPTPVPTPQPTPVVGPSKLYLPEIIR